ncbi:MAG: hypothetical protein D6689_19780 [Deltaproteobacteria bacterium]|nr:MAG: hypothetical protein D6689_19780 [Deltaproteobacteria bacterium]
MSEESRTAPRRPNSLIGSQPVCSPRAALLARSRDRALAQRDRRAARRRWLAIVAAVAAAGVGCGDSDAQSAPPAARAESAPGAAPAPAAPRRVEHAVYSLVDNRLAAHVTFAGGLWVPLGSRRATKYLRFRKSDLPADLAVDVAGERAARPHGDVLSLYAPLTSEQATTAAEVWVRVHADRGGPATLRVNGADAATVDVPAGWSTAAFAVPAGRLRAGENELALFGARRGGFAFAWWQVGGARPYDESAPLGGPAGLELTADRGLAWYVVVPDGGALVIDGAGPGCTINVVAHADRGEPVRGAVTDGGGAVDLSALAGEAVRLDLTLDGCARARLPRAALTVPGPAPTTRTGPPPRYVILWIMDSLRADRLRIINPKARPETPHFDQLATEAAVFRQAYVQGNESRVSHASMWSSLYPVVHDMLSPKAKLADKWFTIDELAKKAGLYASGETGNGYVARKWGFGDDWDAFRNHIHEGGGLSGEDILSRGLATVEGRRDPWLLYLGTIDTHVSWRAKEPWISRYDPEPYRGRFGKMASGTVVDKIAAGAIKPSPRDIDRLRALYDSNVSYQDALVGKLFDTLDAWGIRDQTMVVLTADHGDELLENGKIGHGVSVREALVHVPLVIYYPPLVPAGTIDEAVEGIDIMPTIADALGVAPDDNWQGASLLPLAQGVGRGYPTLAFVSHYEKKHAGRLGRWKVHAAGAKAELYDVEADPLEQRNVADEWPIARRAVEDALWLLRVYNARWRKARWGNPANVTAAFAADLGE